jgi:hypothetical protein
LNTGTNHCGSCNVDKIKYNNHRNLPNPSCKSKNREEQTIIAAATREATKTVAAAAAAAAAAAVVFVR